MLKFFKSLFVKKQKGPLRFSVFAMGKLVFTGDCHEDLERGIRELFEDIDARQSASIKNVQGTTKHTRWRGFRSRFVIKENYVNGDTCG